MTAFDAAWSLVKEALPNHKAGCELRLNGYYPHYSHRKYSGECTCHKMCIQCEKKEKWGFPHHSTDLCFDCTEQAAKEGLIDDPLINFMSEHEWRRDNA